MAVNEAGAAAPVTTVIFEVEYRTDDLKQAKAWAQRHALWIFREDEVEAISVDAKVPRVQLPITERYLQDPVD